MSHTILIADDSLIIREALCSLFEREEGFEICGKAENGKEAVEKAQELQPDLILLDLSMPVMNGLEATRVLKRLMPEVPVIMYSAYSDSSTEKEARSAGVWALVSKSENVSVLLGKAHSALEAQELRVSLHSQHAGGSAMMYDFQLARGAICRDATGLRVRVEDVDIYDYVHFSVLDSGDSEEVVGEAGQMSHVAFVHRFSQLGNLFTNRKAA